MKSNQIAIIENTFYTVLSLRMEILEMYRSRMLEVHILSSGSSDDKSELERRGFICHSLPQLVSNPISALRYILRMRSILNQINPKLVCTFTIRPNIFGSLICRVSKYPVVSNVTGIGPLFESQNWVYYISRLLYKYAFKSNLSVFFQNPDDYQQFVHRHYVTTSQAVLLPGSGVDHQHYAPMDRSSESDQLTFLMISRLIKDKGVLEYITACKALKSRYPQVRFQILGPLWTQNLKHNTITKNHINQWEAEGIVEYLGYTYDVRPYIANCDCIVLPSYREGNSNVLMQGGSMAKPLITTDVVGCRNLVINGETGYIVPAKDAQKLADAIEKMINLSHEHRKQMGTKAREYMITNYPKSKVLEAYWNAYLTLQSKI